MSAITIVHQAALGDTLLLLPLIRALRLAKPGWPITLVTKPNLGQMMTMMGWIDGFASADDREHTVWFAPPEMAADGTRKPNAMPKWAKADLLLCAVANSGDAWAENARLARGGGDLAEGGVVFFQPRAPADYPKHVTEWHREQLAALNLPEAPVELPRVNPDGAILIHPGSGGDAKCWPRERFLGLARALKLNGILPTFILGEAEQEKWGTALMKELHGEFSWYLHMGLFELAERMARARVYLGNDSGVTHLAGALGIPTIALFGPSNEVQWGPVGPAVRVVRAAGVWGDLGDLEEGVVLGEVMGELRKL